MLMAWDESPYPQDAVAMRKKMMKQRELIWRNSKKLSVLEEEAQERAQSLLRRAGQQRMEQEEELREMSKVGGIGLGDR